MQRWNWFLSADFNGKWITTKGYAEVELSSATFTASLKYGTDSATYHNIVASIDSDDFVDAIVSTPGEATTFGLQGPLFKAQMDDGVGSKTLILTDGTTVLGMTFGPLSHDNNL